jgi:hypothetical protein
MTCECIDSIVEKTKGISYEIILVDNASTDGSKEFFEGDNRITYIYSKKNGGFGYGNNLGMKIAKGKYFLLLNSDTLLVNNAVKEFFDYAEAHDEKRVYGCYLEHADRSYCSSFFFFPAFTIKEFIKRVMVNDLCVGGDYTEKDVQAISGADMFFHHEIYDRIGGFDENIFLYGEEGEWQYRMLKADYRCCLIPFPRIIHLEGKSMKESPLKLSVKWCSHFYILKKHMRPVTYYLARIYYALNITIRNMGHLFDTEHRTFWKTIYS